MSTNGVILPPSPAARRLSTPTLRDGRLLIGVLLLLVSVVVGARLLSTRDRSTPVVSATRDLAAGHVLTAADLGTTSVRLDSGVSGDYYAARSTGSLLGRALTRPVGRGELLPGSALAAGAAAPTEQVSLSVAAGRLPGLHAGDHVDVYATADVRSAGTAAAADVCTTTMIGSGLEVVDDVSADANGAGASGNVAVVLRVPPALAPTFVHAGESASIDLVLDPDGSPVAIQAAGATAVPTTAPAITAIGSLASGACAGGK